MNVHLARAGRVVQWGVIAALLSFGTTGCDLSSLKGERSPPAVTITEPVTGAQIGADEQVAVLVSATGSEGVTRIEFWVDGSLHSSQVNPLPNGSISFVSQHLWASDTAGQHILLAKAYDVNGLVSPDALVVVTVLPREPVAVTTPASSSSVLVAPTEAPPTVPPWTVQPITVPTPTTVLKAVSSQRPAACGLITDFDDFETWTRGDEPYGTFIRSSASAHSGSFSGELSYNFPTGGNDYVVFQKTYPMGGRGTQIRAWVYGDGRGHFLNAWVRDAGGEIWQSSFGQVRHTGWQQMVAYIGPELAWPNGHVSGPANGAIDYPIDFRALVLDDAPDTYTGSGVIFVDELSCAEGAPAPPPTRQAAPPTNTAPPPPQGPASIKFWADAETLLPGGCTKLHWTVDNVREVYLDGNGVTGHGEQQVCPTQDTTYTLHVVRADGSPTDKQVTIKRILQQVPNTETPESPPGGGSWGPITVDLAAVDLFARNLPQGAVMLKIKNNGPDNLSDANLSASCRATVQSYTQGSAPSETTQGFSIKTYLDAGTAGDFYTGIDIDTTKNWYEIECSVSTDLKDSNAGNDKYSETIPPPP